MCPNACLTADPTRQRAAARGWEVWGGGEVKINATFLTQTWGQVLDPKGGVKRWNHFGGQVLPLDVGSGGVVSKRSPRRDPTLWPTPATATVSDRKILDEKRIKKFPRVGGHFFAMENATERNAKRGDPTIGNIFLASFFPKSSGMGHKVGSARGGRFLRTTPPDPTSRGSS